MRHCHKTTSLTRLCGTLRPIGSDISDTVRRWTLNSEGGDQQGRLLAKRGFGDGRCYQVNDGSSSRSRRTQFAKPPDELQDADLWCQADIRLPEFCTGPLTLYGVWDWPTYPTDAAAPSTLPEFYTSCMDIDIPGQHSNIQPFSFERTRSN